MWCSELCLRCICWEWFQVFCLCFLCVVVLFEFWILRHGGQSGTEDCVMFPCLVRKDTHSVLEANGLSVQSRLHVQDKSLHVAQTFPSRKNQLQRWQTHRSAEDHKDSGKCAENKDTPRQRQETEHAPNCRRNQHPPFWSPHLAQKGNELVKNRTQSGPEIAHRGTEKVQGVPLSGKSWPAARPAQPDGEGGDGWWKLDFCTGSGNKTVQLCLDSKGSDWPMSTKGNETEGGAQDDVNRVFWCQGHGPDWIPAFWWNCGLWPLLPNFEKPQGSHPSETPAALGGEAQERPAMPISAASQ